MSHLAKYSALVFKSPNCGRHGASWILHLPLQDIPGDEANGCPYVPPVAQGVASLCLFALALSLFLALSILLAPSSSPSLSFQRYSCSSLSLSTGLSIPTRLLLVSPLFLSLLLWLSLSLSLCFPVSLSLSLSPLSGFLLLPPSLAPYSLTLPASLPLLLSKSRLCLIPGLAARWLLCKLSAHTAVRGSALFVWLGHGGSA